MIEVRSTDEFRKWLRGLTDIRAVKKITQRIVRVQAGLAGDAKFFDGIGELRVDYGPGYRVYFVRRGNTVIILLCGGDKGSQDRDIGKPGKWQRKFDMTLRTTPFDAAEYLDDAESQAELLADAFETGDATYIAHALGIVARARGMTSIAKDAGVTREALYKALSEKGDPRLSTLLGVTKALGLQLSAKPVNPV
ncbi:MULTISPECIES: addiction module antidote protein [unclassified Mesorhizobium]|uniref:addiction module antidote protein n=2 Tax=unclassified Mesorhizobium TaxID=325217 RepID=UPI0018CB55E9